MFGLSIKERLVSSRMAFTSNLTLCEATQLEGIKCKLSRKHCLPLIQFFMHQIASTHPINELAAESRSDAPLLSSRQRGSIIINKKLLQNGTSNSSPFPAFQIVCFPLVYESHHTVLFLHGQGFSPPMFIEHLPCIQQS